MDPLRNNKIYTLQNKRSKNPLYFIYFLNATILFIKHSFNIKAYAN